jgi:hypothetical protein
VTSTTTLAASPAAPVTNETVTLVATVTSSRSAAAPSGAVAFENGGKSIGGCEDVSVTPTGQSVTVVCQTSFAADMARLSAVFTPGAGSMVAGSTSATDGLSVGQDSSSLSLTVRRTVYLGATTTYTATVAPPPGRSGPVQPSGTVEFFDSGKTLASCRGEQLLNGGATCTVSYTTLGTHSITASYMGDANFMGSTSPARAVRVVQAPARVGGIITSTMQWLFHYTPAYTNVLAIVVNGASAGATVLVKCHGRGCPYARYSRSIAGPRRCGAKGKPCPAQRNIDLRAGFQGHPLYPGARITVIVSRPGWIGKDYVFAIRAGRPPQIQISCLAPGRIHPGGGC